MTTLVPAASFSAGKGGEYLRLASGKVWAWCPRCEKAFAFGKFHTINPRGAVIPAVACDNPDCGWRSPVVLIGWEEPPEPLL
jgi:hypothetical protein